MWLDTTIKLRAQFHFLKFFLVLLLSMIHFILAIFSLRFHWLFIQVDQLISRTFLLKFTLHAMASIAQKLFYLFLEVVFYLDFSQAYIFFGYYIIRFL